jgi:hypothetical protein
LNACSRFRLKRLMRPCDSLPTTSGTIRCDFERFPDFTRDLEPRLRDALGHVLVHERDLARADHARAEARRAEGLGGQVLLAALAGEVHVVDRVARLVVDADVDVMLGEDFPQLVAHRVVDLVQGELAGKRFLHAVDDRELGRALLALLV